MAEDRMQSPEELRVSRNEDEPEVEGHVFAAEETGGDQDRVAGRKGRMAGRKASPMDADRALGPDRYMA